MALGWRGQYARYRGFFLNILEMYKKNADLRAFLEIMLSLSTISIFVLFALRPTLLTIIHLVKEIDQKKKTVDELTLKVNNLETASQLLDQNITAVPVIYAAIPSVPNPDSVSKQIIGLANTNSVTLLGLSIGQVPITGRLTSQTKPNPDLKPLGSSGEMPISISIKGDYKSILDFTKSLEGSRSVIKIDSLGVNASSTEVGRIVVAVISGRFPFTSQGK